MLAIVKKSDRKDCIVLVKQYRPPLKGWTIEMPAGLVDAGETQEEAAVRELFVILSFLLIEALCFVGGDWVYRSGCTEG